jgi:hypothetical protein
MFWKEGKRLAEIAKPEAPLDAVSFLRQLAVWGLCVKELSLLVSGVFPRDREYRFCQQELRSCCLPLVSTFARIRLANCEGECCGAGAVRLNHPPRDLVRSIGVCPASPPTP